METLAFQFGYRATQEYGNGERIHGNIAVT
jgi:hypothetical protein